MPFDAPRAPVTLRDVARVARVHLSTVSLALRNSPKTAAETRKRVQLTAEKLGYQRDAVSFALSAQRLRPAAINSAPLIAFVTNRPSMADFDLVPHMPGFLAGARSQAAALGFSCELVLVNSDFPASEVAAMLARRRAQGVILAAFLPQLTPLQLEWENYAVVKIDSSFMRPSVPRISYDQQQIVGVACENLHRLGYRRIGMAVGRYDEDSSDQFYTTGYLTAHHLLQAPPLPPLFFEHAETSSSASRRLGAWVKKHRLEAVISNFANTPDLLAAAGIRVPRDVAFANLCLHAPDPATAGVLMSHTTLGEKAVELIALQIKTRQPGVSEEAPTVFVAGEWRDGATAPARDRS